MDGGSVAEARVSAAACSGKLRARCRSEVGFWEVVRGMVVVKPRAAGGGVVKRSAARRARLVDGRRYMVRIWVDCLYAVSFGGGTYWFAPVMALLAVLGGWQQCSKVSGMLLAIAAIYHKIQTRQH